MFKKIYTKIRESFQTAVVAAFIVLMVVLLLYIPFKIIPKIMTSGTSFVATTISSLFVSSEEDNNSTKATTTKNTIEKNNTPIKTTSTDENNSKTNTQTSKYFGKADLSVSLIGVGVIDKNTGQFYQTNYAGLNNIVGVKFMVKNIGTNISGVWRLRLAMPSKTTPNYDSDYQTSLRPGDRIEYVAAFEKPIKTGINNGYVIADYFNNVDELIKSNNYLTIPIRIENTINTNYNDSIEISCGANVDNPRIGNIVTWSANVVGGYDQYLYTWQGSDGLLSIQSPYNGINKVYDTSGIKTAKVIVNINGQTVSKNCGSISVR